MSRIQVVPAGELEAALAQALAPLGQRRPASRGRVARFVAQMRRIGADWHAIRLTDDAGPRFTAFTLLLPGRAGVLMLGCRDVRTLPDECAQVIAAAQRVACERRLHFVQALIEPGAERVLALLRQAGFERLTRLIYLERSISAAPEPRADPPGARWLTYSESRDGLFRACVRTTYAGSYDCPELSGLRPISDVLASHKATGVFEPGLWELATVDETVVGCLLLAPLADGAGLELVYMGVAPEARGRGYGAWLLRRAFEQCRRHGAARLTLGVDARNSVALSVYQRSGLEEVASREAYWWRAGRGRAAHGRPCE